MRVDVFIDTNILVYAHDKDGGERHTRAVALIEGCWQRRERPSLSIQVLQELHVNLIRKGIDVEQSANVVSRYLSWRVVDNTGHLLRQAFVEQQRWKVSFWDSLIIAAARRAGVSTLWSEDLNEGQDYGGLSVVNPLKIRA
jgi:predicted nucleic acid-binding protein